MRMEFKDCGCELDTENRNGTQGGGPHIHRENCRLGHQEPGRLAIEKLEEAVAQPDLKIVKDEPDLKRETVVQFLVEVNKACKGLRKWQDEMLLQALKDQVIKSPILGRCQFFPMGRVDPTVAANYPNQAGGADLWSIGARKFAGRYDQYAPVEEGPRMFHNGHDSVSVLCKEERGEEVCKAIEESWGCRWNNVNFTIKATAAHRWSAT